MDLDSIAADLAADHGLGSKKSDGTYDAIAEELARDHGVKHTTPEGRARVYITAPPISGATKEESNAINEEAAKRPIYKGGPQTGDVLPPTDIGGSIYHNFIGARDLAGAGLNDLQSGSPYKGAAKVLGGGALMAMSPISGAVEGGVEKPITELTGNPDIGSRAGFLASSALPVKLPFVSSVANPSKVLAALPKNKAFETLVDSIGPENVGNVAREMRANPRLSPIDLSPKVLQDTQHLFVTDGPHINYLANAVDNRLNTAKGAVEDAFHQGLGGGPVNPADKIKQLSDNIKAVGAKEINPVLKGTKPVDLSPVISHIDSVLKPGVNAVISNPENMLPYTKVQETLQKFRDMMTNDKTVLTNPDVLNKMQSGIRRQAEQLMRTPDAEAKAIGYSLFGLRNKMIDAIDTAGENPGAYRKALSKYKDENDVASAFEHGHDAIIKNSKNLEDHPSFFKNWVDQASDGEKEAAREGARVAIDTQMNGFKSAARRGTDVGQSDFNHQRIETLFGKVEADRLFDKLEKERKIADSNAKIVAGTQTAMRMASKEKFALPTAGEAGKAMIPAAILETGNVLAHGYPGVGTAMLAAAKGGSMLKHEIATKLAKEHNANYAKFALPTEAPKREELIQALEAVANRQKPTITSRASSVARLFGS